MSLLRKCCCSDNPCDTCDFCNCDDGGSITLTWLMTYSGSMKEGYPPGTALDPCVYQCPGSSIENCGPSGGYESGCSNNICCQGVFTSQGSVTLPLINIPPQQEITLSGPCVQDQRLVNSCTTWAGYFSTPTLSFTANSSQTNYSIVSNVTGEEWGPFSPCQMIKRCRYTYPANCDPSIHPCCSDDYEDVGTMTLGTHPSCYVSVTCSTGQTATVNIEHYRCGNINDPGCTTARGYQHLNQNRTFRFSGWTDQTDNPADQNLTVQSAGGNLTVNAAITRGKSG